MKMASLLILIMPIVVLGFTALAISLESGRSSILNPGAHGFSEVLYAYTSQGNNNGSAFAGLNVNTPFYNLTGGLAMLISRFWLAIPTLALAGALARKKLVPAGSGTLQTHTPLFVALLIGVVVMVGALTFFRPSPWVRRRSTSSMRGTVTEEHRCMSTMARKAQSLFEHGHRPPSRGDAVSKLDPRHQVKNPVMFVVWVGSLLTTLLFFQALVGTGEAPPGLSWP